jgi:hypothetical protein
MSKRLKWILFGLLGWVAFLTLAHVWLNIGFDRVTAAVSQNPDVKNFRVSFLPVT